MISSSLTTAAASSSGAATDASSHRTTPHHTTTTTTSSRRITGGTTTPSSSSSSSARVIRSSAMDHRRRHRSRSTPRTPLATAAGTQPLSYATTTTTTTASLSSTPAASLSGTAAAAMDHTTTNNLHHHPYRRQPRSSSSSSSTNVVVKEELPSLHSYAATTTTTTSAAPGGGGGGPSSAAALLLLLPPRHHPTTEGGGGGRPPPSRHMDDQDHKNTNQNGHKTTTSTTTTTTNNTLPLHQVPSSPPRGETTWAASSSSSGVSLSPSYVRKLVSTTAAAAAAGSGALHNPSHSNNNNHHNPNNNHRNQHNLDTRDPAQRLMESSSREPATALYGSSSSSSSYKSSSATPVAGSSPSKRTGSAGRNRLTHSSSDHFVSSSSSSVKSHHTIHTEPPPRSSATSTPLAAMSSTSSSRRRMPLRSSMTGSLQGSSEEEEENDENNVDDHNNAVHNGKPVATTHLKYRPAAEHPQQQQQQQQLALLSRLERISQRNNTLAIQHIRSYEHHEDHQDETDDDDDEHHGEGVTPSSHSTTKSSSSSLVQRHGHVATSLSPPRRPHHHPPPPLRSDPKLRSDMVKLPALTHPTTTTTAAAAATAEDGTIQSTQSAPAKVAWKSAASAAVTSNDPSGVAWSTATARNPPASSSHQPKTPRVAITGADFVHLRSNSNPPRTTGTPLGHTTTRNNINNNNSNNNNNSSNPRMETSADKLAQKDDNDNDDEGDDWNDHADETTDLPVPPKVTTVDDVEPEVDCLQVDAACLEKHSVVRLQPYHIHNRYIMCQPPPQPPSTATTTTTTTTTSTASLPSASMGVFPAQVVLRPVAWSAPVLCYGAYVRLAAKATKRLGTPEDGHLNHKYSAGVGVVETTNQVCLLPTNKRDKKKNSNNNNNHYHPDDAMFLWQVFRGDSSAHLMEVGSSVAANPLSRPSSLGMVGTTTTAAIPSGAPILLRHVATGGLLSFFSGEWRILTDAYQQEQEPDSSSSSKEDTTTHDQLPLNRLRDHNYIVPSINEVFTFVLDSVPWTTAWIHGGPLACRKFLAKSYLRFPNRHDDGDCDTGAASETFQAIEQLVEMDKSRQYEEQSMRGQERLLVEELLGSFLGLEGTYLQANVLDEHDSSLPGQRMHFFLDRANVLSFDRGLRSLVEGMLPLANNFVLVEEFIAKRLHRFEYGSVMQALCACLDGYILDYSSYITGIEDDYRQKGTMSLRELQVACQPWMEKLSILEKVVFVVADRKGGSLINGLRHLLIHQYQGDEMAEEILRTLLDQASKPFIAMLQQWLANGILDDPYREFMVQCRKGAEWNGRYIMDNQNTLQHFFPTPVEAERVLAAGKYWNAVRACQDESIVDSATVTSSTFSLKYHVNGAQVATYIQSLYTSASQALVRLLMEECDLMGTLQLLKRYFLLDQGDFFLNFLDVAEDELSRDPSKLRQSRVQHLLQVSVPIADNRNVESYRLSPLQQRLRLSPADLACRFASDSLVGEMDRIHLAGGDLNSSIDTSMASPHRLVYAAAGQDHLSRTGVDLFLLEFTQVPFPLSLILSESNLANYRLLFRHLFFAKHVERKLVMVWQDHLSMKEFTSVRGPMGSTYLLRQRMLHCVQNLIYYMMFEVIEPNWLQMTAKISAPTKDKTADEIMSVHSEFLDHTLEACLLTNRDFVLEFTRVMQTCLLFSKQMETFIDKVRLHQDRHQVALENLNRIQHNLHARGSGLVGATTVGEQLAERQQRVLAQTRRVEREVASPEFQRMIVHYESTFTKHLRTFMGVLIKSDDKYHNQKVNLCIRLDYNGYVTSSMGLVQTAR